jgi:hypothetical protein
MAIMVEVPLSDAPDSGVLLVEVERNDIPGELVLATPKPGGVAAKATRSFSESLEQLEPILRAVRDKLVAASPESFQVEFGVKLGGETGVILAKGTAEVNLKITMIWDRQTPDASSP